MKKGFTLAEVLITLGIIGIVAAMTMPTLVAKYQKKVTVNKLRKAYAEIAQAVQLSEAEHGNVDSWSFSSIQGNGDTERAVAFINEYILKRLKTTKICKKEETTECLPNPMKTLDGGTNTGLTSEIYAITASGYSILFHVGGIVEGSPYSQHIHMLVDIDGPFTGANTLGKDIFALTLNMGKQIAISGGEENRDKKSGLVMFGAGWIPALTRDELKSYSTQGCSKDLRGRFCGALIEMDGWEIKDDYPWK